MNLGWDQVRRAFSSRAAIYLALMVIGVAVTFAGGYKMMKPSKKEEYMAAKQNDRIITTLEPELAKAERPKCRIGARR